MVFAGEDRGLAGLLRAGSPEQVDHRALHLGVGEVGHAAAGIKYIGDWVYDDEPTEIKTKNGPLVTLPYTMECNDIPVMIIQHHEGAYWLQKCIDQFDRLYQESAERPKIMAIAIHPYISGQPFRIKYLEQVYEYIAKFPGVHYWTGEQILGWYAKARSQAK